MQCRLVVGNRWFGVSCFYPSSSTEQSKNSGNRWKHYYIWESGDWSIGNCLMSSVRIHTTEMIL